MGGGCRRLACAARPRGGQTPFATGTGPLLPRDPRLPGAAGQRRLAAPLPWCGRAIAARLSAAAGARPGGRPGSAQAAGEGWPAAQAAAETSQQRSARPTCGLRLAAGHAVPGRHTPEAFRHASIVGGRCCWPYAGPVSAGSRAGPCRAPIEVHRSRPGACGCGERGNVEVGRLAGRENRRWPAFHYESPALTNRASCGLLKLPTEAQGRV